MTNGDRSRTVTVKLKINGVPVRPENMIVKEPPIPLLERLINWEAIVIGWL